MTLSKNTRQDLDQTIHVGFLAHERRQEAQCMCTCSVNHRTSHQCASHNVVRITRSIVQITAEH